MTFTGLGGGAPGIRSDLCPCPRQTLELHGAVAVQVAAARYRGPTASCGNYVHAVNDAPFKHRECQGIVKLKAQPFSIVGGRAAQRPSQAQDHRGSTPPPSLVSGGLQSINCPWPRSGHRLLRRAAHCLHAGRGGGRRDIRRQGSPQRRALQCLPLGLFRCLPGVQRLLSDVSYLCTVCCSPLLLW